MKEEQQSDKDLIVRYLSGDKSTLALLVERWHKIFCEKAFWILRDKDLSKDVVQECWIIIIRKMDTLKNAEQFKSWALKIVYTKAIDAHKGRLKQMNDLTQIQLKESMPSKQNDRGAAMRKVLLNGILSLSKDHQDIIRLFYVEEYSLKEISSFLKIPVGTVKSRLFKSREKLKSILKTNGYEK